MLKSNRAYVLSAVVCFYYAFSTPDVVAQGPSLDDRRWSKILTFDTDLGDLDFDEPMLGPVSEIRSCDEERCKVLTVEEGRLTAVTNELRVGLVKGTWRSIYRYDGNRLVEQQEYSPGGRITIYRYQCAANSCVQYRIAENGQAHVAKRYTYSPEQNSLRRETLLDPGIVDIRYDRGFVAYKSQGTPQAPNAIQDSFKRDDQNHIVEAVVAGFPVHFEYDFDGYGNWVKRRTFLHTRDGRRAAGEKVREFKYQP